MAALDLYKQHYNEIAIIITDIQMPRMNGVKLCTAVRELERECGYAPSTIIGLSGNSIDSEVAVAMDYGMNAYLIKPHNRVELQQLIENAPGKETPACHGKILMSRETNYTRTIGLESSSNHLLRSRA